MELLLANGAQVDATRDEDDAAMKEMAMEVDDAEEEDEDEEAALNPAMPFEGWVVVTTGTKFKPAIRHEFNSVL